MSRPPGDNVVIPPVGDTVATDYVGGAHYQKMKVDVGADGETSPVTSTNPLPTALYGRDNSGGIRPVPVTGEGHIEVAIHSPRTPFGELHVEAAYPVFQVDAVYGLNVAEIITTTGNAAIPGAANSGANTGTGNLFKCATGTTQYSFASLQSRRRLRYRPGQGNISRFTMIFSEPAENSILVCGAGTSETGFFFGYNGTSFGILYSNGGVREIRTLTVSTASTATNNYQVTLSGVTTTVTATNNGSTIETAYEISNGVYPGWKAEALGSTVIFVADSVGVKAGAFTLAQTGAGTPAAGSFAETTAGAAGTDTWVPQASWNGDRLDGTGPSGVTLDPQLMNVAQVDFQYLGAGPVVFKVETSVGGNNPDFVTVHTFDFVNARTKPTMTQPCFPFTMSAYSAGSTTDVWVASASAAGFVAGQRVNSGPRMCFARETNGYVGSAASTYYPLFTIRNSVVHSHSGINWRANQTVVYLQSIAASHDDATPITFFLLRNATLQGTPNFSAYDAASALDLDQSATTCTFANNRQIVFAYTLGQSSGGTHIFSDEITLQPGETLTLAARAVTGTATYVIASLNTREDQ